MDKLGLYICIMTRYPHHYHEINHVIMIWFYKLYGYDLVERVFLLYLNKLKKEKKINKHQLTIV